MSGNFKYESFCSLINDGLKRESMSLRELCRRSRMDPSLLSKMLAGKRNPPQDDATLSALARALNEPEDGVFLSVGRLPSAWARLAVDRELCGRVGELVAGSAGRSARRSQSSARGFQDPRAEARRVVSLAPHSSMPDELL